MKFTLKDYQEDAVGQVLDRLKKARRRWHEDDDKNAFSLTATTGAGKTVMAAAVFEALFYGNDDHDFDADPGAVVIWFSDDPSLNTQSRWRLHEASDKLTVSQLEVVETSFNREKLEAGKVYFLNTQKLGRHSLLVRGDVAEGGVASEPRLMPDARAYTIWDTIQHTIEDPALTLYLVLDEAHRGMRPTAGAERPTIVRRLINGARGVPGIPIVMGVSATVQRFNEAMEEMEGHSKMPNVTVPSAKVQESGLLKDTINLDIPNEVGDFATVLLRRGTGKLREISTAWTTYTHSEGSGESVLPLMVLQVPNAPNPNEIARWLDTILEAWPELPPGSIANVFGEHRTEIFGSHSVPYIEPERVEHASHVRILLAKDAISTGWDCPRAEVMVSFRAATDPTHITQLLGRMVRTPLARRIPGNDRLNGVDCLLPYFDRKAVKAVVDALVNGGDGGEKLPGRRVLVNPKEMKPNHDVPEQVWEKLLALPSQALPRRQAKPLKRLSALAHELASDGLLNDAGKKASAELHKVLDGLRARYQEEIAKARESVLAVEGETVRSSVNSSEMSFDDFVEVADYAVIDDAFRRAGRLLGPELAKTYADHLADAAAGSGDDDDLLVDARTDVAAMGLVPGVAPMLDAAAEDLANGWFNKHRIAIKRLPDKRQDIYREINEMSANPLPIGLACPSIRLQATTIFEADGAEKAIPLFDRHLLCDDRGLFPADLNGWESKVLSAELEREGTIAWYRNPSRASQDSLGIVYDDGGGKDIVRPDFIFFASMADGSIAADIVDPHGAHLGDALPKLRGLADYAEANAVVVRRVESIAVVGGKYRLLDLTDQRVRDGVRAAKSASELYESALALDFETTD